MRPSADLNTNAVLCCVSGFTRGGPSTYVPLCVCVQVYYHHAADGHEYYEDDDDDEGDEYHDGYIGPEVYEDFFGMLYYHAFG